jgi:AcrR family transcriptional regulator
MSELARGAGLSLKALYNVFPTKEELFESVIADQYEQYIVPVLDADRAEQSPAERVFSLVDDVLAGMAADRPFLLLFARGSAGVPAKLRAVGRDPYTPYIDAVRNHLIDAIAACPVEADARKAHELAVAFSAALVALATDAFCADPPRASSAVGARVRELFGPALGLTDQQPTTKE